VDRFSPFVVVDVAEFAKIWEAELSTGGGLNQSALNVDLMLVLDTSGSMSWNDPGNLRVAAAEALLDALGGKDRAGLITFDDSASLRARLTYDKAQVKAALGSVGASGGTDITRPMRLALGLLGAGSSLPPTEQAIVLLTDGDGDYDRSLTESARQSGVVVYTVGLGSATDEALLDEIATQTGGKFFLALSAGDLVGIFRDGIAGEVDTDGDGLADTAETAGMRSSTGKVYRTDPDNPDTDGDGLLDGEEMGYSPTPGHAFGRGTAYRMLADPTKADSDADGLNDLFEVSECLYPWMADRDLDGVKGGEEEDYGVLDNSPDTDGDLIDDLEEIESSRTGGGLDPAAVDVVYDKVEFLSELFRGAVCGDITGVWGYCDPGGWPYLVGQIAGGAVFVGVRDVDDALANLVKGDFLNSGISLVGIVPIAGDALKALKLNFNALKNAARLLKSNPTSKEALAIVRLIGRQGGSWVPKSVAVEMLDVVGEGAITRALRNHQALDEDAVLVLARRGYSPQHIELMLDRAVAVRKAPAKGFRLEAEWQGYVRANVWPRSANTEWAVPLPPKQYFLDPGNIPNQINRRFDVKEIADARRGAVSELKKGKSKLLRGQTDPQVRVDGAIQRAMNANEQGFSPAELGFDRIERMFFPD
jgi:hypothetical protein